MEKVGYSPEGAWAGGWGGSLQGPHPLNLHRQDLGSSVPPRGPPPAPGPLAVCVAQALPSSSLGPGSNPLNEPTLPPGVVKRLGGDRGDNRVLGTASVLWPREEGRESRPGPRICERCSPKQEQAGGQQGETPGFLTPAPRKSDSPQAEQEWGWKIRKTLAERQEKAMGPPWTHKGAASRPGSQLCSSGSQERNLLPSPSPGPQLAPSGGDSVDQGGPPQPGHKCLPRESEHRPPEKPTLRGTGHGVKILQGRLSFLSNPQDLPLAHSPLEPPRTKGWSQNPWRNG